MKFSGYAEKIVRLYNSQISFTDQGLANYNPQAECGQRPNFLHELGIDFTFLNSYIKHLYILDFASWPTNLKYLIPGLLRKFADSWYR